jgi:hypothetical protein
MTNKNATILAFGVFIIWAASMIYDATSLTYDPPAGIQAAFILVLGWIIGGKVASRNGDSNDK